MRTSCAPLFRICSTTRSSIPTRAFGFQLKSLRWIRKKVAVRIADNGIGIPSAQLKRIFKRFYRVPGRVMARVKGTGLGLFIVRSVVEKHGGRVFAESEGPGQGSTFTIQLPRA